MITVLVVMLFFKLSIVSILDYKYPGTDALPLDPETDWISVHRQLNAPDKIHFSKCFSPISVCSTIPDSSVSRNPNPESSSTEQCSCQCKADAAVFLPSIRSCVDKLDECQQQIPFEVSNHHHGKLWIPTFSIPATNSIFAPANKILWNEVAAKEGTTESGLKCSVSNVYVQTDDLWTVRNNSLLFKLERRNRTNYLMWKGSETDAKRLEGSIVQLRISCNNFDPDFYCIVFRIAGIHVNADLAYHFNDLQWNRVELIICVLLSTLLGITLCGGVALWKVCWKSKKSKLISTMQMQFLYHMKQQQMHMEEQIASIKATVDMHSSFENDGDQSPSPSVGMQKRKLYFSADFFEPELMANPPLLAVQFVYELRKMIDIAKDRIRMKRHVPTLTTITEDSESDEYLEIPRPPSRMNDRADEPSPKSQNSTDSGCDSMSDDDVQNQQVQQEQDQKQKHEQELVQKQNQEANQDELRLEDEADDEDTQYDRCQQCTSQLSNNVHVVGSLLPRPVITKAVQVSRIPTIVSSRLISPMTPSPRLPPKPTTSVNGIKTLYDKQNGENAALESAASCMTSKLPSPISTPREPPNLERILSNVPPPLPESTPPSTPPPSRNRLYSGRRRAYAVFPNSDLMLKKSLPRRSKRQQRSSASAVIQASLSLSSPLSASSSSSSSSSLSSSPSTSLSSSSRPSS